MEQAEDVKLGAMGRGLSREDLLANRPPCPPAQA